jgi:DNA-binding NtrC family response regulator
VDREQLKVLIVDDEEQLVTTMAKRLRRRGFAVWEATSGLEGLGHLEETDVHVVLLDVRMPGLDGIQVLREIKMRFPRTEVIIFTGHSDVEAAISGMAMGAFDYLMKPVVLDELVVKIQEAAMRSRLLGEDSGQG